MECTELLIKCFCLSRKQGIFCPMHYPQQEKALIRSTQRPTCRHRRETQKQIPLCCKGSSLPPNGWGVHPGVIPRTETPLKPQNSNFVYYYILFFFTGVLIHLFSAISGEKWTSGETTQTAHSDNHSNSHHSVIGQPLLSHLPISHMSDAIQKILH